LRLTARLLDLAFNDTPTEGNGPFLLAHLTGGGLERGLDLIYPLDEFVGRQPGKDVSGLYRLALDGDDLDHPARNLKRNIHIRRFNRARPANGFVVWTMREKVAYQDSCNRKDSNDNKQRA
jgi:hypothetical protein